MTITTEELERLQDESQLWKELQGALVTNLRLEERVKELEGVLRRYADAYSVKVLYSPSPEQREYDEYSDAQEWTKEALIQNKL